MELNIESIVSNFSDKLTIEGRKRVQDGYALETNDIIENYRTDPEEFTKLYLIEKILELLNVKIIGRNVKFYGPRKIERKPDYSIVYEFNKPILIEAKPLNADLYTKEDKGAINQIKDVFKLAAAKENYDFGIATDGLRWIFINKEQKIIDDIFLLEDFEKIRDYISQKKPIPKHKREEISKNFYKTYNDILHGTNKISESECFVNSIENVEKEGDREEIAQLTINRILFIKFLCESGFVKSIKRDWDLFEYFKGLPKYELNAKLKELFFKIFNSPREDRGGIGSFDPNFSEIPYLNGSLFEWADVENNNPDYTIGADILKRTFEFLDNFKFSHIEELDTNQDVLDPEILGYIFERAMTASDRRGTGAYYTPRQITEYMSKSAIYPQIVEKTKKYLLKNKGYKKEELTQINTIEDVIKLPPVTLDDILTEVIYEIKICDPAVGSGAFLLSSAEVLFKIVMRINRKLKLKYVGLEPEIKKRIIYNLYGLDINPRAIEIARLRLWLWLVESYEMEFIKPLPNLDCNICIGDSLTGYTDIAEFKTDAIQLGLFEENIEEMNKLIEKYEKAKNLYKYASGKYARKLKKEYKLIKKPVEQKLDQKFYYSMKIKNLIPNDGGMGKINLFHWGLEFSEIFDTNKPKEERGFDIIIGNPPYGIKVDETLRDEFELENKDIYGIFISRGLKNLLKNGGILTYIVSDTWLTLGTHLPLRKHILEKQLYKIIRVHQDCFDAVVNPCIFILKNSPNENNEIIVADLTNISTKKDSAELREILFNLEKLIGTSNDKFCVFKYDQNLIKIKSNLPIFVGSPKIFKLMNDSTCNFINKSGVNVRQIEFNGKIVELIKLGDISEVKKGIDTGENKYFLYQDPRVTGNYRNIEEFNKFILTFEELNKISNDDNLRQKVIKNGFHKSRDEYNFDEDLWFQGKFIVPYEKGGESYTEINWLPNYFVPTNYFIDWSSRSVKELNIRTQNEKNKATLRNKEYWFKEGLTFSLTGIYAPTIRIKPAGMFDNKSSGIFSKINRYFILAILCSKLSKFILKNYYMHTVDTQVGVFDDFIFPYCENYEDHKNLIELVGEIIEKQKSNPKYEYTSKEQKLIDKLVCELYGLSEDDIHEVEVWYTRRYPKLSESSPLSEESEK